MMLLRDYGTMRVADVLAPAIGYAENGHPLLERANATIATVAQLFRDYWPTFGGGLSARQPGAGDRQRCSPTKALAATYSRIVKEAESAGGDRVAQIERARESWSKGFVAEAIDRFCRTQEIMDTSGQRHRGVLTADDMAQWTPHVEPPLTYDYRGFTVCKTGPWGQGPVTLQQLALLKGFDFDGLDPTGPDFIHLIVEASKLAYADREVFYGDPDFVEVPMATLLSDAYNGERRKLVTDKASLELRPGSIEGFGAVIKLLPRDRDAGGRRRRADGGPDGLRRADRRAAWQHARRHRAFRHRRSAGNMISSTPSGGWLHSSPVIPELGFCLGTRAQMFWLEEGHPAALGPAGGRAPRCRRRWRCATASRISPGVRPAATARINGSRRFFMRHVHCGMNMQEAIDAPAWHQRAFSELVLAAHRAARRAGAGRPRAADHASPNSSAAATRSRSDRRGRKAGSPPRRASVRAAAPPPMRAACRATPQGGDAGLS